MDLPLRQIQQIFAVWIYAKNQKGDVLWNKNDIDTIKKRKCR